MTNKNDFVELGQSCADVCDALYRGLEGRELNKINESVLDAVKQLASWVVEGMRRSGVSLTAILIAGLWTPSRLRSSSIKGARSLGSSTRRLIRIRLLGGTGTSAESFKFSPYVQSALFVTYLPPSFQIRLSFDIHRNVDRIVANLQLNEEGVSCPPQSVSNF